MFTRDVDNAVGFYTRVLGLRLSDRSEDAFCIWGRTPPSDFTVSYETAG